MNIGNGNGFAVFMRYKRKDLKWYQKLWNFITGHKDRNWCWIPVNKIGE
jgi:hypothetical protein